MNTQPETGLFGCDLVDSRRQKRDAEVSGIVSQYYAGSVCPLVANRDLRFWNYRFAGIADRPNDCPCGPNGEPQPRYQAGQAGRGPIV